jgi:glucokinase
MSRWLIWTVVIVALFVVCAGVASVLFQRTACRAATGNGAIRDFHQFTAEQLERDVRNHVPLGSPRVYVEGFLSGEGMKFSYDPSLNAILASAPCIKGSGIVIQSLGFTFRFDSDSKLKSIESQVHLTGP